MTKSIVIGLAALALSTSAALAAQRYHHHAVNAYSRMGPPPATQATFFRTGGANSNDYTMYLKNLHDSGYNPKNDYKNGLMRVQ